MKDEEMAEQFADNISGLDLTCSLLSAKDKSHAYRLGRYDGFLAGLKAGRPQWHDLRKDPNDLPKGQINRFLFAYVKNYGGKRPMLVCYNGEWFYDANTYNNEVKVIEWCEIPTFDKE